MFWFGVFKCTFIELCPWGLVSFLYSKFRLPVMYSTCQRKFKYMLLIHQSKKKNHIHFSELRVWADAHFTRAVCAFNNKTTISMCPMKLLSRYSNLNFISSSIYIIFLIFLKLTIARWLYFEPTWQLSYQQIFSCFYLKVKLESDLISDDDNFPLFHQWASLWCKRMELIYLLIMSTWKLKCHLWMCVNAKTCYSSCCW